EARAEAAVETEQALAGGRRHGREHTAVPGRRSCRLCAKIAEKATPSADGQDAVHPAPPQRHDGRTRPAQPDAVLVALSAADAGIADIDRRRDLLDDEARAARAARLLGPG